MPRRRCKESKAGLAISKKKALREMAIALDTILGLARDANSSDKRRMAISMITRMVHEVSLSLQGKRKLLAESPWLPEKGKIMPLQDAEDTLH